MAPSAECKLSVDVGDRQTDGQTDIVTDESSSPSVHVPTEQSGWARESVGRGQGAALRCGDNEEGVKQHSLQNATDLAKRNITKQDHEGRERPGEKVDNNSHAGDKTEADCMPGMGSSKTGLVLDDNGTP